MNAESPLVLVVDDEPQLLRFLTAALKSHDYRVMTAETAGEGERLILSHRPDAILLDLGLPDRDGLEVVAHVRGWCDTPIIVITTEGAQEDRQRALQLGANAYITKPIQAPQVIAKVKELLKMT